MGVNGGGREGIGAREEVRKEGTEGGRLGLGGRAWNEAKVGVESAYDVQDGCSKEEER